MPNYVHVCYLSAPRLLSLPLAACFHVFPPSVLVDTLQAATAVYIFTCVLYIHTAGFISERSLYAVARPSVVCPSSVVCDARAPYLGGCNFRQFFYGIWYLCHP